MLVPVTLCQQQDAKLQPEQSVNITTCCVPARATVRDFQAAVGVKLGPRATIIRITYRGCKPASARLLQDLVSELDVAPRFQVSYTSPLVPVRVQLTDGRELQLNIECAGFQSRSERQLLRRHVQLLAILHCNAETGAVFRKSTGISKQRYALLRMTATV